MSSLQEFIKAMPKVELHLHIEGSLEPQMMFDLAQRNGVELSYGSVEEIEAAFRRGARFENLQDFLDLYYAGMSVLKTEADFHDLTLAYLERAAEQNVAHAEIFFDPQAHTDRDVPFETVIKGITRAMDAAEERWGITSQLIMCFLRHLDEEAAFATLRESLPYKDRILGIGLDSGEQGNPPSKFQRVFAEARKQGFRVAVAHAGEEGPPEYVREALDLLQVDRLDHGNRALEDDALVERLAASGMALTVCPLSNYKLCVVDDLRQHPLKIMLDQGLKATMNSDDPSYFDGYVSENYLAVSEALDLGREDILTLARNGIEASFVSPERKKSLQRQLEDYAAAAVA
ncbi:adenosine deaminase [Fodinicurvata fenggangensis]|uniref:adenosine deaminase n=1 Tax=Fodinicurvata fenggangensis TaxID=1121830 RepID=UPI00047E3808|nr:adenosine deaminase [Fodinicurvata fenggangensis]